jgi:N-acetylglucosamine kinase-like BadF-type ATPase
MSSIAILGIDGGGTATTACVADADGQVLGRGQAGPSNIPSVAADDARAALDESIAAAFADAGEAAQPVEVACFGLAGYHRPEGKRLFGEWADRGSWARKRILVNDGDLVLAAGTPEGWGVGVISGMDSIVAGRWPDGRTARAGGWGYLFGDEGSAYAVALAGLRWVAHRADGRVAAGSHDILTERLCNALGIAGPADLISAVYAPGFDRTLIAALAPVIVTAAEDDPFVAEGILNPATNDLAEVVITVAHRLGWHEWDRQAPLPLAMAGSFLLSAPIVWEGLLSALQSMGLAVEATPVPDPVQGAIILARKALAG